MAKKRRNDGILPVTVRNPESGQTFVATSKAFNSVYRDKGFELVDRENAEKAASGKGTKPNPKAGDNIGSAADVAAKVGITGTPGSSIDPATGGRVIGQSKGTGADGDPAGNNA